LVHIYESESHILNILVHLVRPGLEIGGTNAEAELCDFPRSPYTGRRGIQNLENCIQTSGGKLAGGYILPKTLNRHIVPKKSENLCVKASSTEPLLEFLENISAILETGEAPIRTNEIPWTNTIPLIQQNIRIIRGKGYRRAGFIVPRIRIHSE
jgi:hypothetical protein